MGASTIVRLPLGKRLLNRAERSDYAYFLTAGIASSVAMLSGCRTAEVQLLGTEGVVGSLQLLGPAVQPTPIIMQVEGEGLRIPFDALQRAFDTSAAIRLRLLESIQMHAFTTMQMAGCHAVHDVEARLSRWLLMIADRTGARGLRLTHESIAKMIGAQRTTVTMAANKMQHRGIIRYSRGYVEILNRSALEEAACGCYNVYKRFFDGLYTQPVRDLVRHSA